mmetsp:Transcript_45519/g.74170  ORF Transcript_45519/g.74170 Transcript_45519/m.74170 type:complete len:171 (-) Transcript_45519:38-550(-)
MYNGIGLQTPRGSGTNGYVQRNLSFMRQKTGQQIDYNKPNEMAPPPAKKPNKVMQEHQRKRELELKILQFREAMEARNYTPEEIEVKVAEIRQKVAEKAVDTVNAEESAKNGDQEVDTSAPHPADALMADHPARKQQAEMEEKATARWKETQAREKEMERARVLQESFHH